MTEAIGIVSQGTAGIHVSLDIDVLDPTVAPGVNTPARGGLTNREARLAVEMLAQSGKMLALDVVELNPLRDRKSCTTILAIELILAALGQSIL
ncbi:MAG: arginase family protein [Planctomycetes bacterium]|nr:arginase family protein [Planctomycetota bacterium]